MGAPRTFDSLSGKKQWSRLLRTVALFSCISLVVEVAGPGPVAAWMNPSVNPNVLALPKVRPAEEPAPPAPSSDIASPDLPSINPPVIAAPSPKQSVGFPAGYPTLPGPDPVDNRVPAASTVTSKGFDPVLSTEIPGLRDEFSKTFANPDGTYTVQASSMPLHYQAANGEWLDVDNLGADPCLNLGKHRHG